MLSVLQKNVFQYLILPMFLCTRVQKLSENKNYQYWVLRTFISAPEVSKCSDKVLLFLILVELRNKCCLNEHYTEFDLFKRYILLVLLALSHSIIIFVWLLSLLYFILTLCDILLAYFVLFAHNFKHKGQCGYSASEEECPNMKLQLFNKDWFVRGL